MIVELNELAQAGKLLLLSVATLVWLAAVLAIAVVKRSALAAAGVFIAGAFLVWGMWNSDWIRDKAGEDISGAPAATVNIEASWTSTPN